MPDLPDNPLHSVDALLSRLGIVVADRDTAYPMEYRQHRECIGNFLWLGVKLSPALDTARKFNSSIR